MTSPHPPEEISTLLIIDAQYEPCGPWYHWWLAGPPPTGTHPDPAGAWHALHAEPDPLADRSREPDLATSYGPECAFIRGFWHGRWVQTGFGRNGVTASNRWQRLRPLLQPFPPADDS
jgi:hypothetical protein